MLYDHSLYDNWPYYIESRIWYRNSVSFKYAHGFVESPFCFGWSISGNSIEIVWFIMMTSSNENIFGITGHLCREFTGHRLILLAKAERWCSFFICASLNGWASNREAGNLRRHRAHYDVIVMVNDISPRMVAGRFSIYHDIPSTIKVTLIEMSYQTCIKITQTYDLYMNHNMTSRFPKYVKRERLNHDAKMCSISHEIYTRMCLMYCGYIITSETNDVIPLLTSIRDVFLFKAPYSCLNGREVTVIDMAHYHHDVLMSMKASQIPSPTIVCSTGYSGADQRKHQSSVSLAFLLGIHRWRVNSPHKGPVTRKTFPFDDVIM